MRCRVARLMPRASAATRRFLRNGPVRADLRCVRRRRGHRFLRASRPRAGRPRAPLAEPFRRDPEREAGGPGLADHQVILSMARNAPTARRRPMMRAFGNSAAEMALFDPPGGFGRDCGYQPGKLSVRFARQEEHPGRRPAVLHDRRSGPSCNSDPRCGSENADHDGRLWAAVPRGTSLSRSCLRAPRSRRRRSIAPSAGTTHRRRACPPVHRHALPVGQHPQQPSARRLSRRSMVGFAAATDRRLSAARPHRAVPLR